MTDLSTNLQLPFLAAAQAQKHVTLNEALRGLDAIVHLSVADRTLASPPSSPADGARWIVAASPSGAWAGRAGQVAAFQDGAWAFAQPRTGWRAWVASEGLLYVYDGSAWIQAAAAAIAAAVSGKLAAASNLADVASAKAALDNISVRGADIASAATLNLETATGAVVDVTGSTTVTAVTLGDGHLRSVRFAGSLVLTHGSSLVLPGAANITTAAGDYAHFRGYAGGVVRCVGYSRANGTAISNPGLSNPWTGLAWAGLGDSIGGYYLSQLQTLLGATLTDLHIGGTSFATNVSGAHGIYDQVASIPAGTRLVTVLGGINDWAGAITVGTLGDKTLATFYGALWRFCEEVLRQDASRVLVFIVPYPTVVGVLGAGFEASNQQVYAQAIRDVARKFGCPIIDLAEANVGGIAAAIFTTDGVHPTTAGGARIAKFIYDRLLYVQPTGFTMAGTVATPTFSPAAGSYASAQTVAISCATSGASIRYTTDGSDPTIDSSVYSSAITVASSATIKAKAFKDGYVASAVGSAAYSIAGTQVATPSFSPAAGTFAVSQSVTISCATSGATIYYTTDGSTPTTSSSVYSSAIPVATSKTIKALAVKSGMTDSAIGSAVYTIGRVGTAAFSTTDAAANGATLSNANGTVTCSTGGGFKSVRLDMSASSGKKHIEFKAGTQGSGAYVAIGMANAGAAVANTYLGAVAYSFGSFDNAASNYGNGFTFASSSYMSTIVANDVIAIDIDFTAGKAWISKNGVYVSGDPVAGTSPSVTFTPATVGALYPGLSFYSSACTFSVQSAAADQTYGPPSGFTAWE